MSPRPYRRSAPPAADTRERILTAARAILAAPGDPGRLTIDAVAREADVARMTVYYQFGSKAGLLEALFDWLAAGTLVPPLLRAMEQPDPLAALDGMIDAFLRFWDSDRLVMRRIRAMQAIDDEVAAALAGRDERRRGILDRIVGRLPDAPPPGSARDELIDTLNALTNVATYDMLAGDKRPRAAVARIIKRLARAALAGDLPRTEAGSRVSGRSTDTPDTA